MVIGMVIAAFVHIPLSKHPVQNDGVQSDVDVSEDPGRSGQERPEASMHPFDPCYEEALSRLGNALR